MLNGSVVVLQDVVAVKLYRITRTDGVEDHRIPDNTIVDAQVIYAIPAIVCDEGVDIMARYGIRCADGEGLLVSVKPRMGKCAIFLHAEINRIPVVISRINI